MQETQEIRVQSLGQEDSLEQEMQPTLVSLPGESHGRGIWWTIVHGIAKSQTQLSTHIHTHSQVKGNVITWPGTSSVPGEITEIFFPMQDRNEKSVFFSNG